MAVCASVHAIFAAVDGVALGIMVNRWAAAEPDQQELFFETAFAVRQIEAASSASSGSCSASLQDFSPGRFSLALSRQFVSVGSAAWGG